MKQTISALPNECVYFAIAKKHMIYIMFEIEIAATGIPLLIIQNVEFKLIKTY